MKKLLPLLTLLLVISLAAACGDDDSDSTADDADTTSADAATTSDGESKPHTEATSEELETWQSDLNAVGCYAGAIDGDLGPQTEAAIKAFQAASGLTTDGLLGPQTEAALLDAVDAGETVCTSTGSEADGDDGEGALAPIQQTTLTSASYGPQTFNLGTCSVNADVSNISLRGEVNNLTLVVDATSGTGTLAVSGGTESDGITLNGDIESVSVESDDSFTANGTFTAPNNAGESFELSGQCTGG